MPLDLSKLSPAARAHYLEIGAQYATADTLAQADATLAAWDAMGAAIPALADADKTRLRDARDALVAAGVDREAARVGKKTTNAAFTAAIHIAKDERGEARAILGSVASRLLESTDAGAIAGKAMIDATLEKTHVSGGDGKKLAEQLDVLGAALRDKNVAAEAAARGGAEAEKSLADAAKAIRDAMAVRVTTPGTPTESETLHVIDGMIVELARGARKAARARAKKLASPALAKAFELSKLYETRHGRTTAGALPPAGTAV